MRKITFRELDFGPLSDFETTDKVPNDWYVVVADIKDSTKWIERGRYREINYVGAACIAAARNVIDMKDIFYVFGGDGASFLISPGHLDTLLEALAGVRQMALNNMGFDLRVGRVQVSELLKEQEQIRLGKIAWGPTEIFSFFRGHGTLRAEKIIKTDLQVASGESSDSHADLSGLSCKILPFPSIRGNILSVIIECPLSLQEEDRIFASLFDLLKRDGPIDRFRPVKPENFRRAAVPASWKMESRLRLKKRAIVLRIFSYLRTLLEDIFIYYVFTLDIPIPILGRPSEYQGYLFQQSDWIKLDGSLRLVLDTTDAEEKMIREFLEKLESEKKISFGMHSSSQALMTCYFKGGKSSGQRHVHFVDGDDGGLTMAAKEMKNKRATLV